MKGSSVWNFWLVAEGFIILLCVAWVIYLSVRHVIITLTRTSSIPTKNLDEHLDIDLEESCFEDRAHRKTR